MEFFLMDGAFIVNAGDKNIDLVFPADFCFIFHITKETFSLLWKKT